MVPAEDKEGRTRETRLRHQLKSLVKTTQPQKPPAYSPRSKELHGGVRVAVSQRRLNPREGQSTWPVGAEVTDIPFTTMGMHHRLATHIRAS
jgi:hypothetical protein